MTKLYLGADHAGFELKEKIKSYLESKEGYDIIDCGAGKFIDGDDYPKYMAEVARNIKIDAEHAPSLGIIFGGSGTGEAIVANRFAHVRAVVYNGNDLEIVKLGKEHNDANVLSVGARFVNEKKTVEAVEMFLNTNFSHEERHSDRIIQIEEITKQ